MNIKEAIEIVTNAIQANDKMTAEQDRALAVVQKAVAKKILHGKWNTINSIPGLHLCSKCDYWSGSCSKYCPNCGAKMDGEDRNV